MHELAELASRIKRWSRELGFAATGIAGVELGEDEAHLHDWLAQGQHGEMDYMARHGDKRSRPAELLPGTLRVISVRMDYGTGQDAEAWQTLANGERAYVARYALGRDYHKLMRARLKKLGAKIEDAVGPHGYRVLTDSAPALEKALARNARLGWIGKHTLLLNRSAGSWFFLGEIYTDLPLPPDPAPEVANECGRCRACINVCPTGAIVAPYTLDARRCISYLTIEHHGAIPLELRPLIGNRIFGCDDCQLVCPWNRHAQVTAEADFAPRHGLDAPRLADLFAWSEEEWLQRTEGMALRRAGYANWLRNLAVALGNAPRSEISVAALQARAEHPDDNVREHVRWALERQQA